jgi:hypothetical protein
MVGYAGRGYPLVHTDPSPASALHRTGWTALHYAVYLRHLPAVRALINAGAPLDIQSNNGWAFRAAGRRGPVPPPMPPSPAGTLRRCTALPTTATPTQWPRCSAPARTRPSGTSGGNAVPRRHGADPLPADRRW